MPTIKVQPSGMQPLGKTTESLKHAREGSSLTQRALPAPASSLLPGLAVPLVASLLLISPARLSAQDLEKCEAPVGTLAMVELQSVALKALGGYGLESPTPVIRIMAQKSQCFIVVERGVAFERMQQERKLARSGDLVGDANIGSGQMLAADFYLTPDVLFSEGNAGGIGGAVGGLLGRRSAGIVGGGLKFKEAETSILITATRSGVQVAAAEGKAKKTDFALGGIGFFGGLVGAAGGYTNTNEGKVIAASFLDNFNNIVKSVRGNPNFPPLSPDEVRALMTGQTAGGGFSEGDIIYPKIDNVEVYEAASNGAPLVTRVLRSDALVYLGTEENGYLQIQSPEGTGWIRKILVTRQ